MSNKNRKLFAERIKILVPTHDIGSQLKNPAEQKLKGLKAFLFAFLFDPQLTLPEAKEWDVFIITTSVLAKGLLEEPFFSVWMKYREGYQIHAHNHKITANQREKAKEAFLEYTTGAEEVNLLLFFFPFVLS